MMSVWIANLGNAAAAAARSDSAPNPSTWPSTWFVRTGFPDWFQLVLVALAVIAAFWIYKAIVDLANRFPKPNEAAGKDQTRMLCDQVWRHSDFMTNVFAERMRQDPGDLAGLHILLRNLREDLAAPVHFVDQMQAQAPSAWPDYALLGAFTNWAGQLKSMASQLADQQTSLAYPPGKDAADKHREQMLIYKFLTERTILSRGIGQLRGHAFTFCDAARKSLDEKKKKNPFFARQGEDEDETETQRDCPCCRHRHEHLQIQPLDPLHLPPLPVPPKPPTPPPPPAAPTTACCCAVPRLCQCARCACVCACTPGAATKPAAHA